MITTRDAQAAGPGRSLRALGAVVEVLAPLLGRMLKVLPGLERRLADTLGGRSGATFRLMEERRFAEAFRLATENARHCAQREYAFGMGRLYWWVFAECAVQSASELGPEERASAETLLGEAPEPGGMHEAHCLATRSRWRWSEGRRPEALELARRAVLADPTWAEGHSSLAWYGLVTGQFDPLPQLREALRLSPAAITQIRATREFLDQPELIAALEDTLRGG